MKKLVKHINLEKAGTLKNFLTESERMNITHLKISGQLNSSDFYVLDEMCTSWGERDEDDNFIIDDEVSPSLIDLDLGESILIDIPILEEFMYYPKLERFIFPKNVQEICEYGVFEGSYFLKTVEFSKTLKVIGFNAFGNCIKLPEINLPNSLEEIRDFAFYDCDSLKNVEIPAKVSFIGCAAFGGCTKLDKFIVHEDNQSFTTIDGVLFNREKTKLIAFPCGYKSKHYIVPEGVQVIGEGAFAGANIETIELPSSLQTIECCAFQSCQNIKSLVIPNSVTEIGKLAFMNCTNLSKITLSENLTILKEQTFTSCNKLKELIIPSSVKKIEQFALAWTKNIESLTLNEGLEEIADYLKFTKIKKLVIPSTVKKIVSGLAIIGSESDFHNIEFEVNEDNPYFTTISGSLYNKSKTRLISIFPTDPKEFIVPKGTRIIEDYVFMNQKLEKIILPNTIVTIKHRCFENCRNLKEITLPKSLQRIDFRAFGNCINLEKIKIKALTPPKITNPSAGDWEFARDAKKATLYVPEQSLKEYKKAFGWKDIKKIKALNSD